MTASDTLAYKPTQSQVLILRNDTGASKTVNIDGANATTISPSGYGGTISVAGGKDIVIADGATSFVRLSDIKAFLAGTIAITAKRGQSMRNALTEIGEMIIGCNDKQWFLKPSLRAMINIGSPQDIVHTYAVLNGLDVRNAIEQCMNVFGGVVPVYVAKAINTKHYQRSILSAAQVVMQSCCDEDLTLMVGGWKNGKRGMVYVPGRMPVGDIVRLASHLMEHGIIGKSPLKQPQRHAEAGKTTQEFHAVEYISSARGIYYEVGADVADLLTGAQQANRAFDDIGKSADRTSARLKNLDSSSRSTGKAVVRAANDSSQAAKTMEALGNEIAILEERNKNGARSAAILSAELRAGAGATAAQRKEIGQLTGQLYDMKNAQDQGTRSSSGLKTGISAIAAAISIGQIISYAKAFLDTADAMTQLQARIDRLVPSAEQGVQHSRRYQ
ncbi:hypothetical protein GH714_044110 [Hevea brasiliensis]|uniref:Uncharacterized protein n=1 Tax=Hevea brasiliensis TaxID=3981 RepID=A0A6A6K1U8_HEVBR|nr:hypothetical protein GH714_044110 [Hevea brasiliensis]